MPAILVTWDVDIWRIMSQGQPSQKGLETLSQPTKAGHSDTHLSSQLLEGMGGRIVAQGKSWGKCETLPEK
jgi:hypothetical protein